MFPPPRLLVLWLLWPLPGIIASAAVPRTEPGVVMISGRPSVELNHWASGRKLRMQFDRKSGDIRLANTSTHLAFDTSSRRAEVQGTAVYLNWPVTMRPDGPYIAKVDLEHTIEPLLGQPKLAVGRKIRTVAIGAGHGGKDPGKQVGTRQEKDFTLKLALELERQLRRAGFNVVMIRRIDEFVNLGERPAIARKKGADIFLSLHYNAGAETAKGVETYSLTPPGAPSTNDIEGHAMPKMPGNGQDTQNLLLGWHVHRAIIAQTGLEDRGLKHARFLELTQMSMPAVLIEGGFLTNPDDAKTIVGAESRQKFAAAITAGVLSYKRQVERQVP